MNHCQIALIVVTNTEDIYETDYINMSVVHAIATKRRLLLVAVFLVSLGFRENAVPYI